MAARSTSELTYTTYDAVADKDLTSPPETPDDGDRYIVGAESDGDWDGHDTKIAEYDGDEEEWVFTTPSENDQLEVSDESLIYKFNGTTWESTGYSSSNVQTYMNTEIKRTTTVAGTLVPTDSGLGLITELISDPVDPPDVLDDDLNTPPVSPSTGDKYIVGTSPNGAWSEHAKEIAEYNGVSWDFIPPVNKQTFYSVDENSIFIYREKTKTWEDTGYAENLGPVLSLETAPPGNPTTGDTYAIDDSASGAWNTHDGKVAIYNGSGWDLFTPYVGMRIVNKATSKILESVSGDWTETSDKLSDFGITLYKEP